ncbi:hypothetical protein [Ammoniphilus sp. 3BR4]|uniref:hypothetical protein n=1 Tax=Ammoniphilus sp. 3BR4 TaxID=3158265 RepID=UPI003466F60F
MADLTPFHDFDMASCVPGAGFLYAGWIAEVAIKAVSGGGAGGFFLMKYKL